MGSHFGYRVTGQLYNVLSGMRLCDTKNIYIYINFIESMIEKH